MICTQCSAPVSSLYTEHSKDNIHATKCGKCHQFADSYIEGDNLLVIIDLMLLRAAAIRHVVFNANLGIRTVYRLFVMATLFDVYLMWGMYEKIGDEKVLLFLQTTHPFVQYVLFIALSACHTLAQQCVIRWLSLKLLNFRNHYALSVSLLVCSFFKLLPILTFIWHYDIPFVGQVVKYTSIVSMVEMLRVTLDCSYFYSILLTLTANLVTLGMDSVFWALN